MQSLEELSREIESIRQEIREGAAKFATPEAFYEFRKSFLDNKAGKIGHLMKEMRNVPKEDKAAYGKNVNVLRDWAQEHFKDMENAVRAKQLEMRYEREKIDVTEPAVRTFYLSPEFLLRTQTSAGQIHVMESKKPPIKIVSPGKVFRSDDDATHSPMFTQMEGLVVDKGITLCDLKGMLDVFVKRIFGEETSTRLRPSFFPFTEPSVEVDVSCFECGGKGCRLCKGTGWIEVLGAGVVNKKVLENCGIDSDEYSGFAFGLGLERIAMLKYGINNIKLLFESDLRFLKQIND